MASNAELGMTIQKLICERYGIVPHPNAVKQFESAYNPTYYDAAIRVIHSIFSELDLTPVECLTFSPSNNPHETRNPHNFLLSNGTTLSIRTNRSGDKVAPRTVGQAGIETFNEHFSDIAGFEIDNKNQIKAVVYDKIHLMLPIFIDYLFVSDYTVWVQLLDNNEFSYRIFDKGSLVDIDLERKAFSFTKDLGSWTESTTLKYRGRSLAEIQIHKNRTFKFRFIMNTLSELLVDQKKTTETLGITAEKVICDLFGLPTPREYRNRYSIPLSYEIRPTIKDAFKNLPRVIKSTGAEKGSRGGSSKSPYDFVLEDEKTLSLKTNTGKMICPPEVGQPGASTCYYYFKEFINGTEVTPDAFKEMVMNHIADIMPIYVSHLFDSDYLLWIYKTEEQYEFKVYDSEFAKHVTWRAENFSFSKASIEEWNESNTVKYRGIPIGEFQVHKKRCCYKFRFNMENFDALVRQDAFN